MSKSEHTLAEIRTGTRRAGGAVALVAGLSALSALQVVAQEGAGLGTPLAPEAVADLDISITPDGKGLPAGSGTPEQGKTIFAARCASCHGAEGAGGEGLVEPLAGGQASLNSAAPLKTVGSYWPYASTLFDYTRRAMPLDAPLSLSDDEVYAITAYVLSLNGIIEADARMDADSLAKVEMPNKDGFVSQWPGYTH